MRQEKLQNAAMMAVDILKGNLKEYTYKFPGSNSEKLFIRSRKCRMDHWFLHRDLLAGL